MILPYSLLFIYAICLFLLLIYCGIELNLAIQYRKFKRRNKNKPILILSQIIDNQELYPFVTVQLPMYNEQYVAERCIKSVINFDYPKNKLQIQVLDDSTDITTEIARKQVEFYKNKGFDITLHHRIDRSGFKAGALKEALPHAKGEYIVIFDADFVPYPDFLLKTLPYLVQNNKVGFIQTPWEHINKHYSVLTILQAFFMDVHFSVEQLGRNAAGYFMNFNGTSGVWRKQAILEAGNWHSDTLIEDVDLSYRAQLNGWEGRLVDTIKSPAELPADITSFKSQQFRWIKGGVEISRKLLGQVYNYPNISFFKRLNAMVHLLSSTMFLVVFVASTVSVLLLMFKTPEMQEKYAKYGSLFLLNNVAMVYVYLSALKHASLSFSDRWKSTLLILPLFATFTLGLSLNNAFAALQGWIGKKTPFVRTPKYNINSQTDTWQNKLYNAQQVDGITILEGIGAIYFGFGVYYAYQTQDFTFLPFHIVLTLGYGWIFFYSIKHYISAKLQGVKKAATV